MKTKILMMCLLLIMFSVSSLAQGKWTKKATAAKSMEGAVGFSLGNKGYRCAGKYGNPDVYYSNGLYQYDSENDSWAYKTPFSALGRYMAVGFSIGEKGYVGTGQGYQYPSGDYHLKDFWEYDPTTDSWAQRADFGGAAREGAVGFSIGNKGYIGTGETTDYLLGTVTYYKDFWEYDPVANTWVQKAGFPGTARSKAYGLSIGNKGYIGTGETTDYNLGTVIYYKDFWEYDPATDLWSRKADFGGNALSGAAGFSIGGRGYMGKPGNNNFWEYNPDADTWDKRADYSGVGYADPYGFSIGRKGYMGTGKEGEWWDDDEFWEFDPDWRAPVITSFSPSFGAIGSAVTITGENFSAVPEENIVYFGATKAEVISATSTALLVKVPFGATYQPVTVTVINLTPYSNLTAYAALPFIVTFEGGKGPFTSSSFAPRKNFITADEGPDDLLSTDLDGDGKPDIVTNNSSGNKISIFRNTSAAGSVSFAPPIRFVPGNNPVAPLAMADLDGDGKIDLAYVIKGDYSMVISKNTSSAGEINFDPAIVLPFDCFDADAMAFGDFDVDGKPDLVTMGSWGGTAVQKNISKDGHIAFTAQCSEESALLNCRNPKDVAINDIDGDAKPDLLVFDSGFDAIRVFLNNSRPGRISFDGRDFRFSINDIAAHIAVGDLDGDNKADIAVANLNSGSISVFRNTSSTGNVSFAARVDYSTGEGSRPYHLSICDLDGDAKPDIVYTDQFNSTVSVLRNLSEPGTILFDTKVNYASGDGVSGISIVDLDADSKPDIAVANALENSFSVLKNQKTELVITSVSNINSSQGTIHWNTFANPSSFRVRVNSSGSTNFRYYGYGTPITDTFKKIINLLPLTTYDAQVKAVLSGGTDSTDWSLPYSFTTQGYCNPPTGLSVGNIGMHSVQLNWVSPVTAVSHYELRVCKTGDTTWTVRPVNPAKEYLVIKGLRANTSYQWQLRSGCINIEDKSNWAKGPGFTTAAAIAPASTEVGTSNFVVAGKTGLQVIPNPNKGNFTVQMQLPAKAASTTIALYNNFGQLIWQQNLGNISGAVNKTIALENKISAGLYTLTIQRSDIKLNQKMLINK